MNQAILLESNADNIDFMIHGIFSIKVFGQEVWITTSHACILIVMAIMVIFAIVANRKLKKAKEVPDGFQNIIELIVEMLDKMVEGTMGKWAPRFVNYISTIFIFILMSNISGLFGLRPPTADYGTTLALALITFVLIQYSAFKTSKLHVFTDLFKPIPILFPINLIGEFAVPLSLSLRLFGNVMSGTVLMGLIYDLLKPFTIGYPALLHAYFDLFSGCIQAYVFCMLTMVYVNDKIAD